MTQQPFTPAGVTAMQTELNQLSQSELQTQCDEISSDLSSWVSTNFSLTQDQQTYLSGMDASFFAYAGPVTAFAILNNLTVSLSVPQSPPTTFKLIHASDDIEVTQSPDGFTVTGGVTYTVEYQ